MSYDFSSFDTKLKEIISWLQDEYSGIRTGRATPALLDSVRVMMYGAPSPINQVASVMAEDARTLRLSVWDGTQLKAVEKALTDANLGVSVAVDGSGIRVIFPELSSERRAQLLKLAKQRLEDARVSVRSERDDENKKIHNELASEDEARNAKDDMQKRVDDVNKKLADLFALKEKELAQ